MKEATLDQLMQALGWTLIHSLWQTFLVALCLYVLLAFSHKLSPSLRYGLGVIALLFTGFLATATFLDLYFYHQPELEELQNDIYIRESSSQVMEFFHTKPSQKLEENTSFQFAEVIQGIKNFLNLHLEWIVVLWMSGVLLLSLRFTGSLYYIHRLKNRLVKPLEDKWQNKMQKMANLLQLQQSVKLLASEMVKVPIMIGHLKPVILIPAAMVSSIPEDQLEAIIAHEIAHIYRKDYWINVLQSLFEIIFFFHPAIWWTSSIIREEREKCCDDLAILLSGDSITYAKALASVEEAKLQHVQMVLAANGGKGSLFHRIERILEPGKSAVNLRARFVSASLAMITLLILGSAGDSIAFKYGEKKAYEAIQWINTIELKDEIIPTGIDFNKHQESDRKTLQRLHQQDTVSVLNMPVSPLNPTNHIENDSVRQVNKATAISHQIHAFPNIDPVLLQLKDLDSIPDIVRDISSILDSIPKFDFSYDSDSSFVFILKDGDKSRNFHFDVPDMDLSTFTFEFDSAIDIRILSDSLPQALARLDASLQRVPPLTYGYQFHVQDTSIEKRLRELEASMRKKEKEFQHLMQEKEAMIQELLRDKELEVIEDQMRKQERILEEQMEQQEEHMRIQEKMMEQQLEELERNLKDQEEKFQHEESRYEEANQALEQMLIKDGLIAEGKKYSFRLSSEGLFINDEKLNDQYYKKYLQWMQENEVFKFEEGSTLSITRLAH